MDTNFLRGQQRLLEAARVEDDKNGGKSTRERFAKDFTNGIKDNLKNGEFEFRYLLEHVIPEGKEILRDYNVNGETALLEAGGTAGAVAFTDFSNITGQIMYSMIKPQWDAPKFLHTQMVDSKFTPFQNGEKIPGIGALGDDSESIPEGELYPTGKLSEEYIELPKTTKRGFRVDVTKEAVFGDRTGQVLSMASSLGASMGYEEEKRFLDLITGVTNNYKYNGTAIDTYGDDSGTHNWDNLAASNGLVDYTDVETALLLWDGMSHPITGEPIMPEGYDVLVPSALNMTARNILNATEIVKVDNQANAATLRYKAANPLSSMSFTLRNNQYVSLRTGSSTTWYMGDFRKAFVECYNWQMKVEQAPMNSQMEFDRDIVASFKASKKSEYGTLEPRYVIKCTA
jgi:hypothetical protein